MTLSPLTEHHLEFVSLKVGCTGSPKSTLSKYHIVVNHMFGLKCFITPGARQAYTVSVFNPITVISSTRHQAFTVLKQK